MWSVAPIIVVAVIGALVFFVAGAAIAITVSRRHHRRLLQNHGIGTGLFNYHRAQLSVNENNYANVPRPETALRRSASQEAIPAIWNSLPSEETIQPEAAPGSPIDTTPDPPSAKRRKSIRSIRLPKTRRQRKIDKSISLSRMPRSPLSAITEFTDTSLTDMASAAELPAESRSIAVDITEPDHEEPEIDWPQPALHSRRIRSDERPPSSIIEDTRPTFQRSTSMSSTMSNAPNEPLPPLPTFDTHKHSRNSRRKTSTTSLDTVGSSVLGIVISSPSHAEIDKTVPPSDLNSGMQNFDFGFAARRSTARFGLSPARSTFHHGTNSGITSVRPSVDWHTNRHTGTMSTLQSNGSLQTIDASKWNSHLKVGQSRSSKQSMRHSLQDYGSVLGKRGQLGGDAVHMEDPFVQDVPPRPASVASSHPFRWNDQPLFSADRHSASSASSARKGHRRQNCVRITGLPGPDTRSVRVEEMPQVEEEQPETPSEDTPKIPGLNLLEAGKPVLRARASLVDVKGSPSPLHNRPVLLPTRPRQPAYYRTSDSSTGFSRPDSDIFSNASSNTPDIYVTAAPQWPLSPTSLTDIRLNSNPVSPYASQRSSPTLPSPINFAMSSTRKSLVKGPRSLPQSGRSSRHASPSPGSGRYSKPTGDELRKSVMLLRSMNSEGRLLDQNGRIYRSIGEEPAMPSFGNLNGALFPLEKRSSTNNFGRTRSRMGLTTSASAMSTGAMSIWDDASVRGDSPEPEVPVPKPLDIHHPQPQTPTPRMNIPYPDPEGYENTPINYGKGWGNRDRMASPQGRGLGLRVNNAIMGTPGSLYDRDGFLKD